MASRNNRFPILLAAAALASQLPSTGHSEPGYSAADFQGRFRAFAYNVSLDNRASDIGTDRQPRDYLQNIECRWKPSRGQGDVELAMSICTDNCLNNSPANEPVVLTPGKILGLMVTCYDNDGSDLLGALALEV